MIVRLPATPAGHAGEVGMAGAEDQAIRPSR
jgi:hypothetical protein